MTNGPQSGILAPAMGNTRFILVKPEALLHLLERAATEDPQDLMFEVLDIAANTEVQLRPEDPDE